MRKSKREPTIHYEWLPITDSAQALATLLADLKREVQRVEPVVRLSETGENTDTRYTSAAPH